MIRQGVPPLVRETRSIARIRSAKSVLMLARCRKGRPAGCPAHLPHLKCSARITMPVLVAMGSPVSSARPGPQGGRLFAVELTHATVRAGSVVLRRRAYTISVVVSALVTRESKVRQS